MGRITIYHKTTKDLLHDHVIEDGDPLPWRSAIEDATRNNVSLVAARLADAQLTGLDAAGTRLAYAVLHNANLRSSRLRFARLGFANLIQADLTTADLRGANLQCADLTGADLTSACLRGANLRGAILDHACLHKADLSFADLTDVSAQRARLTSANLSHASLARADLQYAAMQGAVLHRVIADDACFRGAGHMGDAIVQRTSLVGADLSFVQLIDVVLDLNFLAGANIDDTLLCLDFDDRARMVHDDANGVYDRCITMPSSQEAERRVQWWRRRLSATPVVDLIGRLRQHIESSSTIGQRMSMPDVTKQPVPPLAAWILAVAGIASDSVDDPVDQATWICQVSLGVVPHLWHDESEAFSQVARLEHWQRAWLK